MAIVGWKNNCDDRKKFLLFFVINTTHVPGIEEITNWKRQNSEYLHNFEIIRICGWSMIIVISSLLESDTRLDVF